MLFKTPTKIDFRKLSLYEKEDTTTGSRELACTADACEVVNIGEVA